MPTILTKKSDTPGAVPATANLTNAAGGAELAVNTADKRLFSINSSSAVIELGTNPSSLTCADASFTVARITSLTISSLSLTNATFASATITNLTSTSATISSALTLSGGTANGVLYLNGSKVATSGSALTYNGTAFSASASGAISGIFNRDTSSGATLQIQVVGNNVGTLGSDTGGNGRFDLAAASSMQLRATGAGSFMSFDANNAEQMRLTSTGLGIGTASPTYKLDVDRGASNGVVARFGRSSGQFAHIYADTASVYFGSDNGANTAWQFNESSDYLAAWTAGSERLRIDSSGNLGLGVTPSAWATIKPLEIGYIGNAFSGYINDVGIYATSNAYYNGGWKYAASSKLATRYSAEAGVHSWSYAASGTAGNAITFTQAMTLDADGRLLIGTTTQLGRLTAASTGYSVLALQTTSSSSARGGAINFCNEGGSTDGQILYDTASDFMAFNTNGSERARITAGGQFLVGTTTTSGGEVARFQGSTNCSVGIIAQTSGASYLNFGNTSDANVGFIGYDHTNNFMNFRTNGLERARITAAGEFVVGKTSTLLTTAGVVIEATGSTGIATGSAIPLYINRQTDDGTLIEFRQANTTEGTISVSGNTVSYNAFAGSHWSQLQDGSKPDILRGTVMESINELCVWPGEQNERLPKSKVSDTAGSKKVYGVFMAWDNDWTETNDMYVTAVGAFICRVNGSVTVQEGDLLESNGDGTARVQADDIIRSSTIGKVTSTVKTHQYDDGSYCVPTVLYCG